MLKPLEGVKVVELTLAGAGPAAGGTLSVFGADSIWVEPLEGNSTRTINELHFYCQGKRSITLNLKSPEGLDVMYRMIKESDVFLTNYRQRSVDKLGLGYEKLREMNPRLIYASLTGWGLEGPIADAPGFDTVCFWARGGMLRDFAEMGTLVVPPVAVGDAGVGQAVAGGICAALYRRSISGEGCWVDSSILAQAVYLNHDALIELQHGEKYPKSRKSPRRALLNTYKCKDDKWIVISSTYFDRHFSKLMEILGRKDLVGDPRWNCIEDTMFENAPPVVEILDEGFAKLTQNEAVEALNAIDMAVERVASSEDVLTDPQILANNYVIPWTKPADGKKYTMPAYPVHFNGKDVDPIKPAPGLGEHSVSILQSLGYSEAEIKNMLDKKVTSKS